MSGRISYFSLYRIIAATNYGTILSRNIRFGGFKPDSVGNRKWEQLLGADVNNLRHMWFTKKLTDQFLAFSADQYSPEDAHFLRLTATFHDLAESIVGDIPKTAKTTTDEQVEQRVLTELVQELCQKYPDVTTLQPDLDTCIDSIIFPATPNRLAETFMIIENLGYLHTACRAQLVADTVKQPILHAALTSLASEVVYYSLKKLDPYQNCYSAIAAFYATDLIKAAINAQSANPLIEPLLPVLVLALNS